MAYLSNGIGTSLQKFFSRFAINLSIKENFFIAENSQDLTTQKICELIKEAGFCPVISENREANRNILFTIVPYQHPEYFRQEKLPIESPDDMSVSTSFSSPVETCFRNYNKEIEKLTAQFPKNYQVHYEKNKKNIISFAQGIEGSALILGLGNGFDIPLSELATQFNEVTAIDIDKVGMLRTVEKMAPHLQKKIQLVQCDLTGLIQFISEKVENLSTSLTTSELLKATVQIFEAAIQQKGPPILSKKYNFVISSMLTSQLSSAVHAYTMDVLEKKQPKVKADVSNCQALTIAAEHLLMDATCIKHLESLSQVTHPTGRIYYSDTTHLQFVNLEIKHVKENNTIKTIGVPILGPKFDAISIEEINKKISELFVPLQSSESWAWITRPPVVTPDHIIKGNHMTVVAHYLQPKNNQ